MSALYLIVIHAHLCLEASKGIKSPNPLPDPSHCHWANLLHNKPAYAKWLQKMFQPITIQPTPTSSSTARKSTPWRSSSPPPSRVVTHPIGRASCYDPGPTKFSSPSQQPPSLHSTTHIPAPSAPIVRPLTPRPPLPQQPPPQFYYQQYQTPSSWDNQTSTPHQPEEEPLIDLSPDTDHEMTPPDDPIPLAPITPLADPLIPTPMEHEPAPTIMT